MSFLFRHTYVKLIYSTSETEVLSGLVLLATTIAKKSFSPVLSTSWSMGKTHASRPCMPWNLRFILNSDYIMPVLQELHWFSAVYCAKFKVLVIVYKTLNGPGPKYLWDLLLHYESVHPFQSEKEGLSTAPSFHRSHTCCCHSYTGEIAFDLVYV